MEKVDVSKLRFGRKLTVEEVMKDRENLIKLQEAANEKQRLDLRQKEQGFEELKEKIFSNTFLISQALREVKIYFEKPEPFTSDHDFLYEADEKAGLAYEHLENGIEQIETLLQKI